jgi:hypothetical protein
MPQIPTVKNPVHKNAAAGSHGKGARKLTQEARQEGTADPRFSIERA